MKKLEIIINDFLEYGEKLNKSEKTLKVYKTEVGLFIKKYNIQSAEDLRILEDNIFLMNTWLNDVKEYAPKTINKKKAILSVFSNFLIIEGILSENKIHKISNVYNDNVKIDTYSKNEIKKIFDYMQNKINENKFQRHIDRELYIVKMTMVKLLYKNALRISEVCSIKMRDFNLNESTKFYIRGKGGKGNITRFNSFSKDMIEPMNECADIRSNIKIKEDSSEYFFISPISKARITEDTLRYFLKNILKELNIEYSSPCHDFRHTKLSELAGKGVEVSKIATFAGHKSSNTTEKFYIHQKEKTMEDLVNM